MSMRPTDVRLPGAVDLSALKKRASEPATGSVSAHVVDVTEASFQTEVLDRSMQVPVLIDFWADWCGPCKQLSPVLERLAQADGGSWVLAKVDVDANQRLAAAFQVQSIPTVFAVIAGQPLPLFQGALPEAQVRAVLDEVLRVAKENGLAGAGPSSGPGDPATPAGPAGPAGPLAQAAPAAPPDEAQAALQRGDLEAAAAIYRTRLEADPGDALTRSSLARIELLRRTRGADEAAVRNAATERPNDLDAQLAAADLDVVLGNVDAAFSRLIELVRRSTGPERDRARHHLLGLFEAVDPEDPRVAAARRSLANALF